ncbi:MAG: pilus assembly protein TadG-related protein, partial [Candidatus Limnocylindria bacterium]
MLVLTAVGMSLLLAFSGLAIDIGRQVAERRYLQNAADAAALAGCQSLVEGALDSAAASAARDVATLNISRSPAGGSPGMAAAEATQYEPGHAGDPAYLSSGVVVNGTTVRVAVTSNVPTVLARLVGVAAFDVGARSRCDLEGGPGLPLVARRYANPPGPASGFVDHLATEASSTVGMVDRANVLGYDNGSRQPASLNEPGPVFALYGPDSKAGNDAAFRGFVALDIRNFSSVSSRVYYNGVAPGMTAATIKDIEGGYIVDGYPGPAFPPVATPPDPNDQVAILSGNDTSMVLGNLEQVHSVGDDLLLALYNGTVMKIPDFSITPPRSIEVPASGTVAVGPSFSVSRNREFESTVTLYLRGDAAAALASPARPEYVLIDEPPSTSPPASGRMNMPTWSTNVFTPEVTGTTVQMLQMTTNGVPAGIYT